MENIIKSSRYDFTVRRGEHDVQQLLNWKVNGVDFDLEEADEIRVDFRMNPRVCGAADLSLSVSNEGLRVYTNNVDMNFGDNTLNMHPGVYHYDVLVVKNGERSNWVKGVMVLEDVITR